MEKAEGRVSRAFRLQNLIGYSYPPNRFGLPGLLERDRAGQEFLARCRCNSAARHKSQRLLCRAVWHGRERCAPAPWKVIEPVLVGREGLHVDFITLYVGVSINQLIKSLTLFAYGVLAMLLLAVSKRLFFVLIPFFVYGFFFSGITYFGGILLSISYLWSLISLCGLTILAQRRATPVGYRWFFLISGIISAYVFLLDGHLLLLIPLYVILLYHLTHTTASELARYRAIVTYPGVFFFGLFGAIVLDQLITTYYLRWDRVVDLFIRALNFRLSDSFRGVTYPMSEIYRITFKGYLLTAAYQEVLLFRFLQLGIVAGVVGTVGGIGLWLVRGQLRYVLSIPPFVIGIGLIIARFYLFRNHAVIHSHFLGRYMFVPLSLGWSALIMVWLVHRDERRQHESAGAPSVTHAHDQRPKANAPVRSRVTGRSCRSNPVTRLYRVRFASII